MPSLWTITPGESTRIDLGRIDAVRLSVIGGNLTVIGHDSPSTRIEVTRVEGTALQIAQAGNGLRIEQDKRRHHLARWMSTAEVDLTLLLPHSAALALGNMNANVVTSSIYRSVRCSTVSGSIILDGCVGSADLNSVSGEVSLIGHDAQTHKLRIKTVSGNVTVSAVASDVEIHSVSADMTLDINGAIRKLEVNQVSGNVIARLDPQPLRYDLYAKKGVTVDGVHHNSWYKFADVSATGKVDLKNASGDTTIVHRAE